MSIGVGWWKSDTYFEPPYSEKIPAGRFTVTIKAMRPTMVLVDIIYDNHPKYNCYNEVKQIDYIYIGSWNPPKPEIFEKDLFKI